MLTSKEEVESANGVVLNGVDNPNVLSMDSTEPLKTVIDEEKLESVNGSEVISPDTAKEKLSTDEKKADEKKPDESASPEEKKGEKKEVADDKSVKDKTDEHQKDDKTPASVQKRIDELTRLRRSAERDSSFKDKKIAALEEEIQKLKETSSAAAKPVKEDFESEDEYIEALTDWKIDQKLNKQPQSEKKDDKVREEVNTRWDAIDEMFDAGGEKHEDFKELVMNPTLQLTEAMVDLVIESENAEEVMYYLAKNADLSAKIAVMPLVKAAKEIGKIEKEVGLQLSKPTEKKEEVKEAKAAPVEKKTVSTAPEPITPVRTESRISADPNTMSPKEYRKWRESQGG